MGTPTADVVGLVLWERRHAVRAVLPGRTLCGIPTGLVRIEEVPGLTIFDGQGEGGFSPCRRCLPMWPRVLDLEHQGTAPEIAGNSSTDRNVRRLISGSAARVTA